jgi:hypothetical protein
LSLTSRSGGPKRNFQVFSALDFLAELTQHIPDKGEHLVRYYGWYSHRRRGMRPPGTGSFCAIRGPKCACPRLVCDDGKKTCSAASLTGDHRAGFLSTWAMLLKRVFEVDPLECPHCGGRMKIISFIERRQHELIEKILRHCGLWEGPVRTLASPRAPPGPGLRHDAADGPEFVTDGEFLESQRLKRQADKGRGLQLVLDPVYL